MFMVKEEYVNAKNLLSVKIKTQASGFVWFLILAALMLASSLSGTIIGTLVNDAVFRYYYVTDYSVTFIIGLTIAFVILMLMYRQTNAKLSVFPQTNNSRFISSLLLNFQYAILTALSVLAMYILHQGVIKILSAINGGVRLALSVDVGFITAGFFVFLAYIVMIISIIELAGAILRKWTYYAVAVYAALLALLVINIRRFIEYAPEILAFIIKEPSLPLFFVKAAGVWIAVTAAAFIINRRTIYHKSQNSAAKKVVMITAITATAIIAFIVPVIVLLNTTSQGVSSMTAAAYTQTGEYEDYFAGYDQIRVDVSHLPKGSSLRVEGENLAVPDEDGSLTISGNEAIVNGEDSLNNIQGDTIVIRFKPPSTTINGVELTQFANPRITARLDGDALIVDYILDGVNVVILPIWSIAGQFDCFKDKNILPAHTLGYYSGSDSSANIYFQVE